MTTLRIIVPPLLDEIVAESGLLHGDPLHARDRPLACYRGRDVVHAPGSADEHERQDARPPEPAVLAPVDDDSDHQEDD